MTNKIKTILISAAFIIASAGSFFAGRASMPNKPVENMISISESNTKLNELYNRLTTKYFSQLADSSKKIQDYHKIISDDLKIKIKSDIEIANYKDSIARLDSNKNCNDALDAKQLVIYHMGLKAYNDSIQLRECNFQKAVKDSTIVANTIAFNNQVAITRKLENDIKNTAGPRIFTPFANMSYNSFGYIGVGGGLYYHNIGLGAKYITDFKNNGWEANVNVKF